MIEPVIAVCLAGACLALAGAWRSALVLADVRRIRQMCADQRVYRPGLGWTSPAELQSRRRWSWLGLAVSAGLVPVVFLPESTVPRVAAMFSCGVLIGCILRDRRLHRARYTSVCLGTLACALLVYHAAELFTSLPATLIAGMFASFFASQLYLVAGLRKLQSVQFMSGRVILDNLAYGNYQAAAGNREFIRLTTLSRLADLLSSKVFHSVCRLGAILTAAVELALGAGALGLIPTALIFCLAIPSHLGFILVSPRRIVPFTVAALGLLTLATAHPVLADVGLT